ncbi:hypothetical protein WH47_10969 [Habropoda laboriosa]|uniref:Uncharacterized protein n=1 Tax=Habropoda laboriosa TaxID=597456 RepID=A0A0L7R9G9_9HYME|nr:hypothetical protein WH47_10969 [Habropoda laboriosa]
MSSPATLKNKKYEQLVTPLTYLKNTLKLPSRKLWKKDDVRLKSPGDIWSKYRNADKNEKWNCIESPQFIDFSNLLNVEDAYFNKLTVVVSTPKPNLENDTLSNTITDAGASLAESLNNFRLSGIKHEIPDSTDETYQNFNNENAKIKEEYVVHIANVQSVCNIKFVSEDKVKNAKCNKVKKPQNTLILEEEKKVRVFRAKPAPKFIKPRTTFHGNSNNNNEKMNENANGNTQKTNSYQHINKSTELWKKPPFVPCLPRKNLKVPKTPLLQTTTRAQERKRFDDDMKGKERQKEQLRQMVIMTF